MSKILGVHVALIDDAGILHQLAPGDELPEWAEDRVGDHCLILPPEYESESDADSEASAEDPEPTEPEHESEDSTPETPTEGAAPDFTKPAPAKRGRPRKQD